MVLRKIIFPNGCTHVYLFSFKDPGPHGSGRYSEHMLPEIERKDFRKGAQVYFHGFLCLVYEFVFQCPLILIMLWYNNVPNCMAA